MQIKLLPTTMARVAWKVSSVSHEMMGQPSPLCLLPPACGTEAIGVKIPEDLLSSIDYEELDEVDVEVELVGTPYECLPYVQELKDSGYGAAKRQ